MNCFYHHDRSAIGICKSCQKGLCPDCAVDLSHGLACNSRCEEEVERIIALIRNNVKLSATVPKRLAANRRAIAVTSAFYIVIGSIFLTAGISHDVSLLTALGGCFLAFGLFNLSRMREVPKGDAKDSPH